MGWIKARRDARKRARLEAIDDLMKLLRASEDSGFAVATVDEIIGHVNAARRRIDAGDPVGDGLIRDLLAPTGALQDTAIDNGWGDQFIELSKRLC